MALLEYDPKTVLYHYCSAEAFLGIINTKEIWFSNLKSSNDPRELKYGYDNVFEILRATREQTESAEIKRVIDFLEDRLTPFYNRVNVFCTCFTHDGDSLPMWREYGGAYKGLAIGFRPTAITGMPARLQKVRYVSNGNTKELGDVLIEVVSNFHGWGNQMEEINLVASTLSTIVAMKHSTWEYEREVRMTYVQVRDRPVTSGDNLENMVSMKNNMEPIYWQQPNIRSVHGSDTEYLKFPYGRDLGERHDARMAIKEVIAGPNCALTKDEIANALVANGFLNYLIKGSDCQIR
ncbi:DUF2971 domain-containing protein [Methylobacterium sp. W2]|uniref:DUF2971 domain-containing protein n=1 Tax=Methylobacterium sp. W2 TaxID=2598107 RepID=UPI001D0C12B5|nr:DUF2971 domain-containing protein [Methylobacterium sp. W2]MCC0805953.1 DUF2971 domain-containing protein [Methylobacterium sp. W2]